MLLLLFLLLSLVHLNDSSPPPQPVTCTNETSDCTISNAYGAFPDSSICHAANVTYPSTEQELIAAVAAAVAAKRKVKASTSGMVIADLIRVAGEAELSLPHTPYWYGLTIGGVLATGAHGSSLWGKGGAVHEYVVGLRIVTPAPPSQGFAMVRELNAGHPDLDAAKVSLGVLGVISQVTLALQPLFKRSVTFVDRDESDLPAKVTVWGHLYEFGDIKWLPQERKVVYRKDDRVGVSSPGNGLRDSPIFRALPTSTIVAARAEAERLEKNGTDGERCQAQRQLAATEEKEAYGFTNDGVNFTGYPVVGLQHLMQASGSCIHSPEDGLQTSCTWDPRIHGLFNYNSGFSVPLSMAAAFIADVQRLRDLSPAAFCALYSSAGMYMRNSAFEGAIAKYPGAAKFREVKNRYDPDGIFSSEWSDQVLGIKGRPSIVTKRCAIDGLCVCSDDSHCAPELGYFCRPGKVYKQARVCAFEGVTSSS
ncbi:hypothetical protein HU200_066256 [Digitaria exilis]|uniref:FAD-binding PCMH-type domain-containing protein n=1 Tax=Digitaria exilis TaxID=1010633 RepID=A0A834ZWW1_9POAL|nr:hypothetical protein HU200_066256 [Digitaria exilis]